MDAVDLDTLGYRELQAECKKSGVSARGTRAELLARLQSDNTVGKQQEIMSEATPRTTRRSGRTKTPVSAKTEGRYRMNRIDRSEEVIASEKEIYHPDAKTPRAASRHLLQAASTPLPRSPPAAKSNAKNGTATKTMSKPSSAPASLGRLLALLAVTLAVASISLPAWQKYDCGGRLWQRFPGQMQHAALLASSVHQFTAKLSQQATSRVPKAWVSCVQMQYQRAQNAVGVAWQGTQRQCTYVWTTMLQRLQELRASHALEQPPSGDTRAPTCPGLLLTDALANIVPPAALWENLRQTVAAVWQGHKVDPTKASAVLFACVEANCPVVNDWLAWAAQPSDCVLRLQAGELGEDRGALQKALARFLAREPRGTVLLTDMHQLSPHLVPVLINALSEQGAFEQGGRTVPAHQANFLLTMQMPAHILAAESEAAFKVAAKAELVQVLVQHSSAPEETLAQAKALRRRVDYVVPTVF